MQEREGSTRCETRCSSQFTVHRVQLARHTNLARHTTAGPVATFRGRRIRTEPETQNTWAPSTIISWAPKVSSSWRCDGRCDACDNAFIRVVRQAACVQVQNLACRFPFQFQATRRHPAIATDRWRPYVVAGRSHDPQSTTATRDHLTAGTRPSARDGCSESHQKGPRVGEGQL